MALLDVQCGSSSVPARTLRGAAETQASFKVWGRTPYLVRGQSAGKYFSLGFPWACVDGLVRAYEAPRDGETQGRAARPAGRAGRDVVRRPKVPRCAEDELSESRDRAAADVIAVRQSSGRWSALCGYVDAWGAYRAGVRVRGTHGGSRS